ncbi:ribonuclease III [Nostocoides vanveenii]|uniref:Ribonuclease 3 n=1 Tax=Nostocoides vanveenii TaxID=330835 RepID=A0ABN2KSN0_9MICO
MQRPIDELRTALVEGCGVAVEGSLLALALTHRSYAYENGALPHNERLEFLGDSVLGIVVTDYLYRAYPAESEGHLAKLRAAVVNMRALADVGRTVALGDYLLLGRGEESTGGRDKASILADATEAVIGAVFLTGGLPAATDFVHYLLDPVLAASARLGAGLDWKTSLQEASVSRDLGPVEYRIAEAGPEHEKVFTASAVVGGVIRGTGEGRTKKDAEQRAAEQAWHDITASALAPPAC